MKKMNTHPTFLSSPEGKRYVLTLEPSWIRDVRANLAVDLDKPLHEDGQDLLTGERVLETVPQKDDEGQALAQLVRAYQKRNSEE